MNNTREIIRDYLRRVGKPVRVGELIDRVLVRVRYSGNTPRKTVCAIIHRDKDLQVINRWCSLKSNKNSR